MINRHQFAGAIFALNALICLAVGLTFVFASEFFPFHGDVIETDWQALSVSYQTLYLGMMRTEGAGYLATALAVFWLLAIPYRKGEYWSAWAIVTIALMEHLPTLLANLHVAQTTAAEPPWYFVMGCMISLCFGLVLVPRRSR
ncbi:MAG: hypothetical protein AB8B48_19625 [Pseudomonadales bacterium]